MSDRSPSPSIRVPKPTRLAVLTSGGDSAGMNAAVRAVVRTAIAGGLDAFAVFEGLQGLIDGGERIRPMSSAAVGGILQHGGTVLATARSPAFRTRDGLRQAARYLVANIALGIHLFHGAWSVFQSLGWNNPRFNQWRRTPATAIATIIVVGNCSSPIAVRAGIIEI